MDSLNYLENSPQYGLDEQAVSALVEAAKMIGETLDPAEAIEGILTILSEILQLKRGRVLLPNKQSNHLEIAYSHSLTTEEKSRGVYALGEGVTGNVMSSGQIALIPNVVLEPTYLARVTYLNPTSNEPIAYIAVPIFKRDTPIGVLAVHPQVSNHRTLTPALFVLQIIAQMIAQVLGTNHLIKKATQHLLSENQILKNQKLVESIAMGLQGKSTNFLIAVNKASMAAKSEAAVLLVGESGSGKEKFARMIHQLSDRRDMPFICINCAAIPEQLLESELFGHEKGSFTGAIQNRIGKFELASGGTLFLDEIGDMPLELQAKLLRILQEKKLQRVGGNKEISVDVRIISATNKELENAVNVADFRLDLFYRLNVISIQLPPLRERSDDIKLLALHFLNRANQRYSRNAILTPNTLQMLESYSWPGNIRQLENVIERAIIMSEQDKISEVELKSILNDEAKICIVPSYKQPLNHNWQSLPSAEATEFNNRAYSRVRKMEKPVILEAITRAHGNKTAAAKMLGMTPRQLHYRIKKLGITEVDI